jgi:hypothetical protein
MEIPKITKRNEFGLKELPTGQEYKFRSDNTIDWQSIIPKEYIVINKSYENQIVEKLGKPLAEVSIDEVDPKHTLILLGGIKWLAATRGFSKVEYSRPVYGSDGAVVVECKITWLPNYETEMREVVFSGIGEATKNNATPIGKNKLGEYCFYLAAIAENRAFIRAVRGALNIVSLGKDEISSVETIEAAPLPTSGLDPHSMLQGILDSKKPKINFEVLKKTVIGHYKDKVKSDASQWTTLKDIPPNDVFTLIGLLKQEKKV